MKRIFKMKWLLMLILMLSLTTMNADAQRRRGRSQRTSVSRHAKRKTSTHKRKNGRRRMTWEQRVAHSEAKRQARKHRWDRETRDQFETEMLRMHWRAMEEQ